MDKILKCRYCNKILGYAENDNFNVICVCVSHYTEITTSIGDISCVVCGNCPEKHTPNTIAHPFTRHQMNN
jgi:hypothetical protein